MLQEITKMVHWAGDKLKKLGAEVEYANVGMQELPNGTKIPLPPVLMGALGSDPQKKTLLVYGHLDVQPALKEDGWDYEPFVVRFLMSSHNLHSQNIIKQNPGRAR